MTIIKRFLAVAGAAAVLPLLAVTAASASAGPGTVTAVTHASGHPDTCACTTDVTSPNGYVWAYDNLARKFTVTPEASPGNYQVTVTDNGSFSAFAEPNNPDPTTNHPITANGSVRGTITYDVQSSSAPDPSALPAQEPGAVSTSAMISALFNGDATIVGGGAYTYTYRAGGQTMVQSSSSGITGDITG
ncbi:MAG TPA: hypothetical protein VMV92_23305 [Streptosporangiaceae bacterium]|nr:hypothetical protein [Streptosporangiaceae bacterium]